MHLLVHLAYHTTKFIIKEGTKDKPKKKNNPNPPT